jgi:hypothetical protein
MRRSTLAAALLLFGLTGCDKAPTHPVEPAPSDAANASRGVVLTPWARTLEARTGASLHLAEAQPASICGTAANIPLLAGQTQEAGYLSVSNDAEVLYVTYETTGGWTLVKTHLAVATTPYGIPVNNAGAPMPGRFAQQRAHEAGATSTSYDLSFADLGLASGQSVVIAAHAALVRGEETVSAWATGDRFVGSGTWATHFSYELNACSGEPEGTDFVLFATGLFLGPVVATWIEDRAGGNAVCTAYAAAHNISGSDFRIVYSTAIEAARDYLAYDAAEGHRVFDRTGTQIGGDDLWDGSPFVLADLPSWTITGTGPDGRWREPLPTAGMTPGSWPICQYCNRTFACATAGLSAFGPGPTCYTGTRAIMCMGRL